MNTELRIYLQNQRRRVERGSTCFAEPRGITSAERAVIRRSPLSDLLEVEALQDAVQAKRAGWLALAAAKVDPERVPGLIERADDQIARLEVIHAEVAGHLFEG